MRRHVAPQWNRLGRVALEKGRLASRERSRPTSTKGWRIRMQEGSPRERDRGDVEQAHFSSLRV